MLKSGCTKSGRFAWPEATLTPIPIVLIAVGGMPCATRVCTRRRERRSPSRSSTSECQNPPLHWSSANALTRPVAKRPHSAPRVRCSRALLGRRLSQSRLRDPWRRHRHLAPNSNWGKTQCARRPEILLRFVSPISFFPKWARPLGEVSDAAMRAPTLAAAIR